MGLKRILVLGGGFAGLWSAVGAARKLDELGIGPDEVEVTLVNRDAFHSIRVRNYESDLSQVRVPLDDVLEPIDVRRVEGDVVDIRLTEQSVDVRTAKGQTTIPFDRLVFALGSQLARPNVVGLSAAAFDVDTYHEASRLNEHLHSLVDRAVSPGLFTAIVVGAGLTGIETATELVRKFKNLPANDDVARHWRVILMDHNSVVGSDMGDSARPVIEEALGALGVETRLGVEVAAVAPDGITLKNGEEIRAATVVWCAGLRAHPLTRLFPVEHDRFGRIPVDEFMRVKGVHHAFAAGDVACAMVDDRHTSVMSCQHGRPMGRFAGHNVVCDLLNLPMLPLCIDWYVTVLDLGEWGAVYTQGWNRHVVASGKKAKQTKQAINCRRIYPPRSRNRKEILAAATPVVQRPPDFEC